MLSNFETFTDKLLQIVLVGQPELEARLRSRAARPGRTRRRALPLRRSDDCESRAYLDYRLLRVGGTTRLFEPAARDLLLRAAQGVPRRINILFHNALLFAYGRGDARVTVSRSPSRQSRRARALMELPDLSAAAALGCAARPARPHDRGGDRRCAGRRGWRGGGSRAAVRAGPADGSRPDRPAAAAPVAAAPQVVPAVDPVARPLPSPTRPAVAHPATAAAAAAVTSANDEGGSQLASAPVADAATLVAPAPPPVHGAAAVETTERAAGRPSVTRSARERRRTVHGRIVRVRSGQTLAALARQVYGYDDSDVIRRIQSANPPDGRPRRILAGDVLHFPGDGPADPATGRKTCR